MNYRYCKKIIKHIRKRDLIRVTYLKICSFFKKDWRGFSIVKKAFILFSSTLFQKYMWEKYPHLVLKGLELDNSVICKNKHLMDLVFKIQYFYSDFIRPLLSFREMCNIYLLVKKVSGIPGDIVEIGVYRGASAKIICEAKNDKIFHLFDTFSGLPKSNNSIDILAEGEMKDASLEEVREGLKDYVNLFFYKGLFPQTTDSIRDRRFSFIHVDTDLYKSTKDALEFFYERLNRDGIILGHDYNSIDTPGVRKAFDKFFTDKPETIIEIWDSQCFIIKQ